MRAGRLAVGRVRLACGPYGERETDAADVLVGRVAVGRTLAEGRLSGLLDDGVPDLDVDVAGGEKREPHVDVERHLPVGEQRSLSRRDLDGLGVERVELLVDVRDAPQRAGKCHRCMTGQSTCSKALLRETNESAADVAGDRRGNAAAGDGMRNNQLESSYRKVL